MPGLGLTISEALAAVGVADECLALPWRTLALADYGFLAPYGALVRGLGPAPGPMQQA